MLSALELVTGGCKAPLLSGGLDVPFAGLGGVLNEDGEGEGALEGGVDPDVVTAPGGGGPTPRVSFALTPYLISEVASTHRRIENRCKLA